MARPLFQAAPAGSDLFAAYRQPFPENLPAPPPAALSDGIFLPQNGGETAAWRQWRRFLEQAASYSVLKDFPSRKNTSLMGAYLSVGCISPRLLARESLERRLNAWADNIIRRDFSFNLPCSTRMTTLQTAIRNTPCA